MSGNRYNLTLFQSVFLSLSRRAPQKIPNGKQGQVLELEVLGLVAVAEGRAEITEKGKLYSLTLAGR